MLPLSFIATNVHFVIALLAASATFATAWLYLDAWSGSRHFKELLKWTGYGLLALGFLVRATALEPVFLGTSILNHAAPLSLLIQGLGLAVLAIGLSLDPLQPIPHDKSILTIWTEDTLGTAPKEPTDEATATPIWRPYMLAFVLVLAVGLAVFARPAYLPALTLLVTGLYLRRALRGLERHLLPVGLAFGCLSLFQIADIRQWWQNTTDPRLYQLVAPFGPLWIVAQVFLLLGTLVLGRWIWRYLTKRLQTQLFLILTTASIVGFLVTTVSFTFLLMNRMQDAASTALYSTSQVLNYAVTSRLTEANATAEIIAHDPDVTTAIVAHDHTKLAALLSDTLATKKVSSVTVTTADSQVLLRAEEPSRWGDSVSGDTLISRALIGQPSRGLISSNNSLGAHLLMRATTPVRSAGTIVGAVAVGISADNAFVDGLSHTAGLSTTIYSGPVRVATTLVEADGYTRATGTRETNTSITKTVLSQGRSWRGLISTGGQTYLATFTPLLDADNAPVGMLFLGQPETTLYQSAGWAIAITFIVASLLLMLAILPFHLIARNLAKQLK